MAKMTMQSLVSALTNTLLKHSDILNTNLTNVYINIIVQLNLPQVHIQMFAKMYYCKSRGVCLYMYEVSVSRLRFHCA